MNPILLASALLALLGIPRPMIAEESLNIRKIAQRIEARRIEASVRKLVSFGTRNTLSSQTDPNRGVGAARDWLFREFTEIAKASGGRMKVEMQSFLQPKVARIPSPTHITNVLATLEGTDTDPAKRIYIVSGHYDSMASSPTDAISDAPGANDDASGCGAVLELARVMAPLKLRATVVFACVAGEEQGLLGSTYLAERAKADSWNVQAMLTNDIIGNTEGGDGKVDRRTVRVFSEGVPSTETTSEATARRSVGGENDSPSRQLARYIQEAAERHVPGFRVALVFRRDRYGRGGDHIPFNERGFAAVRFTEMNENFQRQHQNVRTEAGMEYGDTPDHVDFGYVAQVARVNCAALVDMAAAPSTPTSVRIVGGLSANTTLRWSTSPSEQVDHYEIVWRDTAAPTWTNSRSAGTATTYTVKGLSKDNYFFGIRSVGPAGMRSVVAFPRVVR